MSTLPPRLLSLVILLLATVFPAAAAPARAQEPPEPLAAPAAATRILSIPAAAFAPAQYDLFYENEGRYISAEPQDTSTLLASVPLPHGAVITRLTACFNDTSPNRDAELRLLRRAWGAPVVLMAQLTSATAAGQVERSVTTFDDPQVNYYTSALYLELHLPPATMGDGEVQGCSVSVEYTPLEVTYGVTGFTGAAFRPFEDAYNANFTQSGGLLRHYLHANGTQQSGVYLAPLNLPDGATVTDITLFYEDNVPGAAIELLLQRTLAANASSYANLAQVSSVDQQTSATTTTIASPQIDNDRFTYWITAVMPSSYAIDPITVRGVRVTYTLPAFAFTRTQALSNAGFVAMNGFYDYANHGRWLFNIEGHPVDTGVYVAPVYLPDGATITTLRATFYHGTATGAAFLARTHKTGLSNEVIASLYTGDSLGYVTLSAAPARIDARVDNWRYAYYVYWLLPASTLPDPPATDDLVGVSMQIDYEPAQFLYLPLTLQ